MLLASTIRSIQHSAKEYDFEIIVADDASDDRTPEIGKELGAIVVSCNNRQIGPTRNDGAAVATGDILIFVDADTVVSNDVIDETVEAIKNGAVVGGSFPNFEGDIKIIARILTPLIRMVFYVARLAAGAYLFCTVESFEKSGGFDPKFFAAEEVHLVRKLRAFGTFKTLNSRVISSGRKFRTHSSMEILTSLILVSIPGIRNIKKRKNLWYGPRKKEEN